MGKAYPQLPWEILGPKGIPFKVGNKPNIFNFSYIIVNIAFPDHWTAMQRKKAAVFEYGCSLWRGQEKEREGFTNTMFFFMLAPSVLTTTFQYLQSHPY